MRDVIIVFTFADLIKSAILIFVLTLFPLFVCLLIYFAGSLFFLLAGHLNIFFFIPSWLICPVFYCFSVYFHSSFSNNIHDLTLSTATNILLILVISSNLSPFTIITVIYHFLKYELVVSFIQLKCNL